MALPKEPRQKMINLMYLVLTALLALNVSAEILNAFKTVDNTLRNSSAMVSQSTATYLSSLKDKENKAETHDKAAIWLPKAQQAAQLSDVMYNYIQSLKDSLLREADFDKKDSSFKEDNLDASTRFLVEKGNGKILYQRLSEYESQMLSIDPAIAKAFAKKMPLDLSMPKTQNPGNNTWEAAYFRMTPTVAALTMLSKFQNDVKTSENKVVEYCHNQVGQVEMIFNTYQPLVGQSSNYLMPGQELTITAGIGAYNSASKPVVSIDGANVNVNANGVAEYKTTVTGVGSGAKKVHISFFNQATGKQDFRDFDVAYTVGSPTGASVSADNVKVFYIGLDNPISVSGGNVGDEKVQVSMTNGNITKSGPGKYVVRPSTPGKATVTVTADGKSTPFEFRVKTVPDPIAKVGNSKGGRMKVNEFKAQFGPRAELENFIFEGVKFNVTGFTIVFTGANFPNLQYREIVGDAFDSVKDLIDKAKGGTTVTLDEIKASGPGGTKTLAPIVFNLY